MAKILVIGDSLAGAKIIAGFLKDQGYETALADDGKSGVERAAKEQFDLAVVDIVLPDISGLEVCRAIKAGRECVKIITVTGVIDAIDAVAARRAGADDFCVKTKDMSQLVEAVKKLI